MSQARFESAYEGKPPWDIGEPQPIVVALEEAGLIEGSVLDVGCGTGENALYLASKGHDVLGVDFVSTAIERANAKARERGVNARFQVGDALKLDQLDRVFDTAIDCGMFHTLTDEQRPAYAESLRQVIRPEGRLFLHCFSDREPPGQGPRRVSQDEIREAFAGGWKVLTINPARFQANDHPETRDFSEGGPRAWVATLIHETP